MAKRWYIAPILSPGAAGTINDGYRSAFADTAGASHFAIIPSHTSGPNIGKPLFSFCFGMVAHLNLAVLGQVSNALIFPDFPLDATMDGMDSPTRAALKQSVEAYVQDSTGKRLDASIVLDDAASFRDVVDSFGSQIQPGWKSRYVAEPAEVTS